ncbi:MAG: aminotransferase class V-fold PLP-dependent enzyme [Flavobacteriaceae bacterium]|nr:aminotransferase class V-fold PLP-dependent enzyme [Flavobacteriaceae bacterium]MDG2386545.1 aminotransferase class V-fold PLP-dependent enzyme [Flavobacteriaceae bacterium]
MKKRDFIKNMGMLGISPLLIHSKNEFLSEEFLPPLPAKEDEIWELIRKQYELHPDFVNLESGYYNIIPKPTMDKHLQHIKRVNLEGSYYMRNHRFNDKASITAKLSDKVGCNPSELIITRNTTESLDLVIAGFPWKEGDHAIHAIQDYGAMQDMFSQVEKRNGIDVTRISIPNHPKNDEEIVSLYESKITSKTKLIMVCHMINITGQILPIKKICDMAHKRGVEVLVDGAHCIGHFDFKIDDLNCDYYGSSLHKWLATPLGAGLLYVHADHIPKIWPLLADHEKDENNIKRLSHTGTHPVATDLAILDAIEYLDWIGIDRKEKRMRFLKTYWQSALKEVPNIRINTPFESHRSCGIGNVGLENMSPAELAKRLYDEYQIFTVAIDYANVKGCRITPNVFTTTNELDQFINAMKNLAKA